MPLCVYKCEIVTPSPPLSRISTSVSGKGAKFYSANVFMIRVDVLDIYFLLGRPHRNSWILKCSSCRNLAGSAHSSSFSMN